MYGCEIISNTTNKIARISPIWLNELMFHSIIWHFKDDYNISYSFSGRKTLPTSSGRIPNKNTNTINVNKYIPYTLVLTLKNPSIFFIIYIKITTENIAIINRIRDPILIVRTHFYV